MHFIRDHVGNLVFSVVSVKGGTRNIQRFFAHYKYTKISMDVATVCLLAHAAPSLSIT